MIKTVCNKILINIILCFCFYSFRDLKEEKMEAKERFGSHGISFNSFLSQKEKLFVFTYFKVFNDFFERICFWSVVAIRNG